MVRNLTLLTKKVLFWILSTCVHVHLLINKKDVLDEVMNCLFINKICNLNYKFF